MRTTSPTKDLLVVTRHNLQAISADWMLAMLPYSLPSGCLAAQRLITNKCHIKLIYKSFLRNVWKLSAIANLKGEKSFAWVWDGKLANQNLWGPHISCSLTFGITTQSSFLYWILTDIHLCFICKNAIPLWFSLTFAQLTYKQNVSSTLCLAILSKNQREAFSSD